MIIRKLFIQLILVVCSIILVLSSIFFYNHLNNYVRKELSQTQKDVPVDSYDKLSSTEMLSFKKVIEAGISLYELPLSVFIKGDTILIESLGTNEIVVNKEKYENLLKFFTYISALPFVIEYHNVCIGIECPVREVSLTLKVFKRR